jgi:hypothetical protein
MSKSRKARNRQRRKRNGFIVKGVSQRHWWDPYDKDNVTSTRGLLKKELRERIDECHNEK